MFLIANELNLKKKRNCLFHNMFHFSYLPYFSLSANGYSFGGYNTNWDILYRGMAILFIKIADPNQSEAKTQKKNKPAKLAFKAQFMPFSSIWKYDGCFAEHRNWNRNLWNLIFTVCILITLPDDDGEDDDSMGMIKPKPYIQLIKLRKFCVLFAAQHCFN